MEIKEFYDYYAEIAKYSSAYALVEWDMRTKMPPKAAMDRAEVAGKLARTIFEMMTSPKMAAFVEYFNRPRVNEKLNEVDRRNVYLMTKEYRRASSIPPEKFEKFTIACSKGESVWQEAKAESNFNKFRPYLEEIVGYLKEFVEYYGYEKNKYDALLEGYEPSMTSEDIKKIIEGLKSELVPFIKEISHGKKPDDSILKGKFDKASQEKLSHEVLEAMGYDFQSGRIDETVHPFTTGIGNGDVRITTNYHLDDMTSALFSTMHEGGHALYEQGISEEYKWMPIHTGASMGIHESQSRTWENLVGRSYEFWKFFFPKLSEIFPQFKKITAEDFYKAINITKPSLIRIEADEVTYNLHIMVRFEIEESLINDRIKVADLPDVWNQKMREYLNVDVPDDAHGVLQDVHWSGGQFGYFPSYMLGNLYASQFFFSAKKEIPDLESQISNGNLKVLREWQREKIHKFGAMYDPKDLIVKVSGEPLNHKYFMNYIKEKFSKIYGIH
ncbi:carboxypeptidase M32 [Athalassotoga saccharophila]|uniref:carboxypeptidase M32 n=1 Tax=Athalassotoga saccharophila TaxID=1441386 RepID=UPI00157FD1D8|nr:carboxypeptidase M32 [Athalassotoga saccharophila]BBJ27694.1 thermostable carboxypeptidase 1 [Athalassotoga saccharophila]